MNSRQRRKKYRQSSDAAALRLALDSLCHAEEVAAEQAAEIEALKADVVNWGTQYSRLEDAYYTLRQQACRLTEEILYLKRERYIAHGPTAVQDRCAVVTPETYDRWPKWGPR